MVDDVFVVLYHGSFFSVVVFVSLAIFLLPIWLVLREISV